LADIRRELLTASTSLEGAENAGLENNGLEFAELEI